MPRLECPSCRRIAPGDSRFCGACGAELPANVKAPETQAGATETSVSDAPSGVRPPASSTPGQATVSDARFPPGTMVSDRYRIVGLLGRGGMGEVYRADDLKLGRAVALKFLPGRVERDPMRLSRFLNEVRTALQVSHPNVCRVHDIGDVAGHHYISMEFVDGDDLAALLRRIGRLPSDKAIETARQLCAGLAAAHAEGILHRDLKPANIMIDGRGQVKITDFGLAGLAGEIEGEEVRAGTPSYMAPEQLAGKEVSTRSDIYSLGLVLYEIFTGKPAFAAGSAAEILRRREAAPTSPSSFVQGLDPAVERVIMRCLEREAAERPGSALAVSAALPGGDPLAAALAAGETPAPELVAEAGAAGGLRPTVAVVCLLAVLATLGVLVGLSERFTLVSRADLPKSPAVLTEKAREILIDLGYDEPPRDSLYTFEYNGAYYAHLQQLERTRDRWDVVARPQPAAVMFAYRQDPELILRQDSGAIMDWINDPPLTAPGAVAVRLDPLGRLQSLVAIPPEREDVATEAAAEPNWNVLLAAAGLDTSQLTEVESTWLPSTWADRREAWEGVYPDTPDVSIRVEAAAYDGRPVSLRIVEPWTRPREDAPPPGGFWSRAGAWVNSAWYLVVLIGSALVAWRNHRLGRGDRRIAVRFALLLAGSRLLWILTDHHVLSSSEIGLLIGHLAWSAYRFGMVCIFYLALEPYARKLWPRMLTSWVRLFHGRLRDPLVGRDLLVAAVYGTALALTVRLMPWTAELLQLPGYGPEAELWSLESLRGFRGAIASLAGIQTTSMLTVFIGVMMVFILRLLLRRTWITVLVVTPLVMVNFNPGQGHPMPYIVFMLIGVTGFWFVFLRFGLLPLVLGFTIADVLRYLPLTFDLAAWWSGPTWLALLFCLCVAGWGSWAALAGRPIFRDQILGEG